MWEGDTHREDVVVVVGELLLGEELQMLGLRVEAKAGFHLCFLSLECVFLSFLSF